MIPGRLYVRNFMSIGEVDINLKNQGLVLISGDNQDIQSANSNAAGKSSLFEALLWCYLGETYRDVNVDRVARIVKETGKVAAGGCAVVHEVEVNGSTYRISRFRKDKKFKNRVVFEQIAPEQVDLTQSKAPDTDKVILRTLGIHPQILQQTTMIGQGMPWKFTDLKDADRKRVMTEMLSLHVWDVGSDEFKRRAGEIQRQIDQAVSALAVQENQLENQMQVINIRRDELRHVESSPPADPEEIKALEAQVQESQLEVEKLVTSLHATNTELRGWNDYLQSAVNKRDQIHAESQQVQEQINQLTAERIEGVQKLQNECRQSELQHVQQQKAQKLAERNELQGKLDLEIANDRSAGEARAVANTKIEACMSRIAQLEQTPDTCPTCGRPGAAELTKPEIEQQKAAMDQHVGLKQERMAEQQANQVIITDRKRSLSGRDAEIKVFDGQLVEIATKTYPQVDTLVHEYDAKKQELDLALGRRGAEFTVEVEKIAGLTARRDSCQTAITNTRNKIEEHSTSVNTRQRRLGELQSLQAGWKAQIEAAKKAVTEVQAEHRQLLEQVEKSKAGRVVLNSTKDHYDWLVTACKKIRSLSMDEALGFINERLRYYMDIFTDSEIQVVLLPETENVTGGTQDKIDIQITTAGGVYQSGSGGEKRRIDLSLYFSLSDLSAHVYGSHISILVCDEIMDALDITGVYRCLDILRAKRDAGLSVFLTSQRGEILRGVTDFDQWWIMQKVGGVSSLLDARAVS